MAGDRIIAYLDKTMVTISGFTIKGLKPYLLEKALAQQLGRPVRVIGVAGSSLKLDIYGLEPDAVLRDEEKIIKAISLVPGLKAQDVYRIDQSERVKAVSMSQIMNSREAACPKERWL